MVWNGTRLQFGAGLKDLHTAFKALPPSKHEVTSFDAQPILAAVDQKSGGNASAMLITVSGIVKWGIDQKTSPFHHIFVLERDNASTAVAAQTASGATGAVSATSGAPITTSTYYVASSVFRNSQVAKQQ